MYFSITTSELFTVHLGLAAVITIQNTCPKLQHVIQDALIFKVRREAYQEFHLDICQNFRFSL